MKVYVLSVELDFEDETEIVGVYSNLNKAWDKAQSQTDASFQSAIENLLPVPGGLPQNRQHSWRWVDPRTCVSNNLCAAIYTIQEYEVQ